MMEVIKKTISLEPFKSRFNNKFMSYSGSTFRMGEFDNEDYSDYGCIPVDLLLATIDESGNTDIEVLSDILYYESDYYNEKMSGYDDGGNTMLKAFDDLLIIGDVVPLRTILEKGDDGKLYKKVIVRHNTLRDAYFEVVNFINESVWYKLCNRVNCDKVWVKSGVEGDKIKWFFDYRPQMLNELPEPNTFELGNLLVNERCEWYKNKYMPENGKRLDYIVFLLYEIIKGHTKFNNSIKKIIPNEDNKSVKVIFSDHKSETYDYNNGKEISDAAKYDDKVGLFFIDKPYTGYSETEIVVQHSNERYLSYTVPFIDIPLCITQTIDNVGILSPVCEMWKPGKKYFVGDKVWFKMPNETYPRLYVLYSAYCEDRNDNYVEREVSVEIFYVIKNLMPEFVRDYTDEDGCTHYFLKEYYYDGCRGIFEGFSLFDDYDYEEGEYILNHWELCEESKDGNVPENMTFYAKLDIINSNITDMCSYALSVDDDGMKLPFKISGGRYTSIPFTMGEKNHRKFEGRIYCDIIMEIDFLRKEDGNKILEKYVYNTISKNVRKYTRNRYNELISEYYDGFNITCEGMSSYDTIRIVYFKDCRLESEDGNYIANSGVEYDEVFPIEYKTRVCNYTGDLCDMLKSGNRNGIISVNDYVYTECDDNVNGFYDTVLFNIVNTFSISKEGGSQDEFVQRIRYDENNILQCNVGRVCKFVGKDGVYNGCELKNGRNYMMQRVFDYFDINIGEHVENPDNKKYLESQVGYIGMQTNKKEMQDVDTYKDEGLFGFVDLKKEYTENEIHVNRGTATALERHNILSEVNTLDDLVNYKNNFFGI